MPVSKASWILAGLIASYALPAGAEESLAEVRHRSGESVLKHIDRQDSGPSWLSAHLDHVSVHKKRGLAYTRAVDHGERGLEWSVQGPAVGRKKTVGLGFELRF